MGLLRHVFDFVSRPTHSRTMGLLTVLILAVAVFLTVNVAQQQQQIKQQAASEITIGFGNQLNYLVEIGTVVNVGIIINNPDNRDISSVDFTLTYDSDKLTLNDFLPEGTYEPIINDNQPGTLHYVGENTSTDTTRTSSTAVLVGTLHFLGKNVPSTPQSSTIEFTPDISQITVSDKTNSIPLSRQSATVTVIAVGTSPTATPVPDGPTNTPTPTPPVGPTATPTPTQAPVPGETVMQFQGGLVNNIFKDKDGILVSNKAQDLTIYLYKSTEDPALDPKGDKINSKYKNKINLSFTNGLFSAPSLNFGKVDVGTYTVLAKSSKYLRKIITTVNVPPEGIAITIPSTFTLADGIGDINDDNILDIIDYNIISSCFAIKANTASCISKNDVDLNDDGEIDRIDYGLFLKSLSFTSRKGD